MRTTITILFITMLGITTQAQDYNNAFKLSSGTFWGVSYKKMFHQTSGFQTSFQIKSHEYQLTALRIFHEPAFPASSSQWFVGYGYGSHLSYKTEISAWNAFRPLAPSNSYKGNFISPGFDGYAALEYRFLKFPFVMAVEYMPNFEFLGPHFFRVNLNNLSFSFAYAF